MTQLKANSGGNTQMIGCSTGMYFQISSENTESKIEKF